jgi:predicted ATPase
MKLEVKNFGPVKSAELEIKPLTILIGKNNLGKSFLA